MGGNYVLCTLLNHNGSVNLIDIHDLTWMMILCNLYILPLHVSLDSERMCANNVIYNGFCVGVVESDEHDACERIFMPRSSPFAIKSQEVQTSIFSKREIFSSSSSHLAFVFGFTSDEGQNNR